MPFCGSFNTSEMFLGLAREFCHIIVFVEMFIMHILQLHNGDLMYFMTSVFVTKNKFLLPFFFECMLFLDFFTSLHVFKKTHMLSVKFDSR